MIIVIIMLLPLKRLSLSGVSLFKVLSRIQFWKQSCFHLYLQKVRYQPPKTEMKSKCETGSSCTPVNKKRIKNVSCGYSRYTTLSLASQPAKPQKKTEITFENNKFTR